ncbi:MAG: (2Fe-2S) ferredoxin domain-containing protein [Eubacteriales bacterium]|nr:(2Fe-2S) ferredoxin domain-containing protein [Eubacteriales bacterium]
MVFVEVCVGSSCHLKGAPDIVALFEKAIAEQHLEEEIILSGSFCTGNCNRIGVTVTVDDVSYTGITKDGFADFWKQTIQPAIEKAKEKSL